MIALRTDRENPCGVERMQAAITLVGLAFASLAQASTVLPTLPTFVRRCFRATATRRWTEPADGLAREADEGQLLLRATGSSVGRIATFALDRR